ncbi:hypothetical protein E2C01_043568 [Portunus trituberculatus]|uniref:Uncharacterized protein n=1 Tax=Portunus trituberculatus TaxID=210409 RepID=A0A5B7FWG1_PORTR|nr:hypothetical protein [Portunus trituberculatus]
MRSCRSRSPRTLTTKPGCGEVVVPHCVKFSRNVKRNDKCSMFHVKGLESGEGQQRGRRDTNVEALQAGAKRGEQIQTGGATLKVDVAVLVVASRLRWWLTERERQDAQIQAWKEHTPCIAVVAASRQQVFANRMKSCLRGTGLVLLTTTLPLASNSIAAAFVPDAP